MDIPASDHPGLTPWERSFLDGVRDRKCLSPRQLEIIGKILAKLAPPKREAAKVTVTSYGGDAKAAEALGEPVRTAEDIKRLISNLPRD